MSEQAVEEGHLCLEFVPDALKTRDMCERAFKEDNRLFKIPYWFVTAEILIKCQDEEWVKRFRRHKL